MIAAIGRRRSEMFAPSPYNGGSPATRITPSLPRKGGSRRSPEVRIGFMLRNLDERGGIGVYTRELLRSMLAQDVRNEYVLFYGSRSALGRHASHPGVTEVVLPCTNKLIWDQVQIPWAAQRHGIDLLFSPKISAPLAFRGPKVFTIHGAEQFLFPDEYPLTDRLYVQTTLPLYASAAERVIVGTRQAIPDTARALRIAPRKISAIHLAASDLFATPVPEDARRAVCERYGLRDPFILYVGLVWGAKNFGVFPRVLEQVRKRHPLLLAHAGMQRPGMREEYHGSPYICRLGFVPDADLAALYQSALALVFPSLYEGFGIPLVEALASGCPIVTSDWGAMKEVCGDAALSVDTRRPEAIAAAVLRLIEEPQLRAELRGRGLERSKQFGWHLTAQATLKTFSEIVERGS
jgi:glycosyltransferase involved in cell wall biosynthesis